MRGPLEWTPSTKSDNFCYLPYALYWLEKLDKYHVCYELLQEVSKATTNKNSNRKIPHCLCTLKSPKFHKSLGDMATARVFSFGYIDPLLRYEWQLK